MRVWRRDGVETPWGPAMPLAQALVELAIDAGSVPGVVSADRALHDGVVTAEQLAEAVAPATGWPRGSRARSMGALADGSSESVAESRSRVILVTSGFDVEPQFLVVDVDGTVVARSDFRVRGTRVLIEVDGRVKYTDPQVLWDEKRREDRLRRMGWTVVRLTWADLDHPALVRQRVRQALRLCA